jgi:hypothetical protein
MYKKNPSIQELLDPSAILIIDAYLCATKLRSKWASLFLPPPEGVYFTNATSPILKTGQPYFSEKSFESNTPIIQLINEEGAIVDKTGKTIITKYTIKKQEQFLTNIPKMPIQELKLIRYDIDCYISDATVPNRLSSTNELGTILTDEGVKSYEDGVFDFLISAFYNSIEELINNDRWHLYFVELNNVDIIIKKTCDYRVYYYHQLIESNQLTDPIFPKKFCKGDEDYD